MESEHRERLKRNRVLLMENINTHQVAPYYFQEGILTRNEYDHITNAAKTPQERAEVLLNTIPKKGPKAYKVFCDGLKSDNGSAWLVDKLEKLTVSDGGGASVEPKLLSKAKLQYTLNTRLERENEVWTRYIHYTDDKFFVTDLRNNKVKIFSKHGRSLGILDGGQYKLKRPRGVTSIPQGDVIVIDFVIKGIVVYDKQLKQKKVIRDLYEGEGHDITYGNNRLVITTYNDQLIVTNMDFEVQKVIDKNCLVNMKEFMPCGIATSSSGDIVTTQQWPNCVYILASTETCVLHTYIPDGKLTLRFPCGVCCDEWGHVFVADCDADCVHVISTTAEHKCVIAGEGDPMRCPVGVTVCGPGLLAVAEGAGEVSVYKYLDI